MSNPYVTINSPDGTTIEIADGATLTGFLNQQLEQFTWLVKHDVSLHNHLYGLIQKALAYVGSGREQNAVDEVFMTHQFPVAGSHFASYLNDLKNQNKLLAALIIRFTTGAAGLDISQWQHLKALSSIIAFDQQLTPKVIESSRAAFSRTLKALQRQEESARSRSVAYEKRLEAAEARYEKLLDVAKRYVSHKIVLQRQKDDQRVKASLDDMEATKAIYMEHMALQAPVEYWKRKANEHKNGARAMRKFLLGYAVIGTLVLLSGLYYLFTRSIEVVTDGAPVSVLFILATMGIVVTTIAFWGGRILTRLYLSEEHLKIDAGERATMVETYLALTKVNQASKEDRAIILASLFRPTADGIVKDDAAPDLSPSGLISKVVAPN